MALAANAPPPAAPARQSAPSTAAPFASAAQSSKPAPAGTIAGFLDRTSAAPGDKLRLFVDTQASSFDLRVYRMGWYDGGSRPRRLIDALTGLPGGQQPTPIQDPTTGLISASNWRLSGVLPVGNWPTGLYDLRLKDANRAESSIPLVVRDDVGAHQLLFQHTCATDQAYNNWGGRSLYNFNSVGQATLGGGPGAVKVSYDRPYAHNEGLGQSVEWEMQMIRWLDANGVDVAYVSDLDVHGNPDFARNARAVIQAGHSEYWSREMRDHLELVRSDGKGLGFFTGDTGSISIRFEPSRMGRDRIQVCYRDAAKDPLATAEPTRATVAWFAPPLNRSVQELIGVGTNAEIARSAAWVVAGAQDMPDVFEGTGLSDGDRVENLVGYEYDGLSTPGALSDLPPGLHILGRSLVAPLRGVNGPLAFVAELSLTPDRRVNPGTLRASVQTVEPGPTWQVEIDMSSSSGSRRLLYAVGSGAPIQFTEGGQVGVRIPLGLDLATPGWGSFERDLAQDYGAVFGRVPSDLQVSGAVLRGSVVVSALDVASADGGVVRLVSGPGGSSGGGAWSARSGWGDLTWGTDEAGNSMLTLRPAIDRRDDVSHSVLIDDGQIGPVVALGTIQWSWALDDFGPRRDRVGTVTQVDPRIQALTTNLLTYLSGGPGRRASSPAGSS